MKKAIAFNKKVQKAAKSSKTIQFTAKIFFRKNHCSILFWKFLIEKMTDTGRF
ncbi:hypothetical protein [Streptococcus orisasini]